MVGCLKGTLKKYFSPHSILMFLLLIFTVDFSEKTNKQKNSIPVSSESCHPSSILITHEDDKYSL